MMHENIPLVDALIYKLPGSRGWTASEALLWVAAFTAALRLTCPVVTPEVVKT